MNHPLIVMFLCATSQARWYLWKGDMGTKSHAIMHGCFKSSNYAAYVQIDNFVFPDL